MVVFLGVGVWMLVFGVSVLLLPLFTGDFGWFNCDFAALICCMCLVV